MKTITLPVFIFAVLAGSSAAFAADKPERLDCMIQPHQDVNLGSPVPGVIHQVLVNRGDPVKRGQAVALLNSVVEQAALEVARERAAQVGEARVADSSRTLASREVERANELYQQRFVSQTYLDKQEAEAQAASGRHTQAQENRRLAERQLELARMQLEQRTIRSPFDGVVVERFLEPGEFIDQKPVLRIASVDPLRVDVLVSADSFGKVPQGARVSVYPEMSGFGPREAIVTTVDRVIDAASNTFRVRLSLPNAKQDLPAGLRCQVDLHASMSKQATRESGPGPVAIAPTGKN